MREERRTEGRSVTVEVGEEGVNGERLTSD